MNIPFVEPFRIKMVERVKQTTREERITILKNAKNNLFAVPAEDVFIDLLTDSGTNAMSDLQWAAMLGADESYAGAKSFFHLADAVKDIMGFPHLLPTHQGRAAEGMLFASLVKKGQIVPNNRHFDTTQANLLALGAQPLDLVVNESNEPLSDLPFKGNMDLQLLEDLLKQAGRAEIPLGMITITNNSAAGQPVSMDNIRQTAELYHRYGIPFFIDCARFAENAWFIKTRDSKYDQCLNPGYRPRDVFLCGWLHNER